MKRKGERKAIRREGGSGHQSHFSTPREKKRRGKKGAILLALRGRKRKKKRRSRKEGGVAYRHSDYEEKRRKKEKTIVFAPLTHGGETLTTTPGTGGGKGGGCDKRGKVWRVVEKGDSWKRNLRGGRKGGKKETEASDGKKKGEVGVSEKKPREFSEDKGRGGKEPTSAGCLLGRKKKKKRKVSAGRKRVVEERQGSWSIVGGKKGGDICARLREKKTWGEKKPDPIPVRGGGNKKEKAHWYKKV